MSVSAIRAALETALNAITPALPTAFENAPFTPIDGQAYQAVNLLSAEPSNPTLGDNFHRELGILQITLLYPPQTGPAAAMARAELIRATFYRGASFTSGGVTVIISGTPEIAPASVDGNRYAVPCKIRFFANI